MLAVGLAIAACQAGFWSTCTTLDDLVRNLREPTYLKPAVLVVDEVG
jgi:hypothetical protein